PYTTLFRSLVVLLGGAAAYYFNTQSNAKVSSQGPVITVSTAVVGLGDLHATVRVNGTVAAQNFKAMLAPRIQGSRRDMNRGGDGGPGGGGRQGGGGGGGGFSGGGGGGGNPGGGGDATAMSMV